jgi:hypothetical protein
VNTTGTEWFPLGGTGTSTASGKVTKLGVGLADTRKECGFRQRFTTVTVEEMLLPAARLKRHADSPAASAAPPATTRTATIDCRARVELADDVKAVEGRCGRRPRAPPRKQTKGKTRLLALTDDPIERVFDFQHTQGAPEPPASSRVAFDLVVAGEGSLILREDMAPIPLSGSI